MLKSLGSNIWCTDHKLSLMGIPLGTRMTIVKLKTDHLLLHSPVPLGEKDRLELYKLGVPYYSIAPNTYHHLYVDHYSEAKIFAAPGLREKRQDLQIFADLEPQPPIEWQGDLDQVQIEGVPGINEVVFFHPKSRSLIVSDLFFNIQKSKSIRTKIFFTLTGTYGQLAISRILSLAVRDKKAFKKSLLKIMDWEFDQLIMAHGEPILTGAKAQVQKLYQQKGIL